MDQFGSISLNTETVTNQQDAALLSIEATTAQGPLSKSYLEDLLYDEAIEIFTRSLREEPPPDLPNDPDGQQFRIGKYVVSLKKQRVAEWKPAELILDGNFFAVPRNVDLNGNIIVTHHDKVSELLMMQQVIHNYYNDDSAGDHKLKVGDPCVAWFEGDGLYYRARVVEAGPTYWVQFLDYGNVHRHLKPSQIHAEVMCSEVPSFAHEFRLDGSPVGSDGQINQLMLNELHNIIVDKIVCLRVNINDCCSDNPKTVKRCSIVINYCTIQKYDDIEGITKFFPAVHVQK